MASPNFVIFLVDDLGWDHVGYHGSRLQTPVIDQLAAGGVKMERFYSMPLCSPARAALLTGRYPIRYGLQSGVVRPWQKEGLPLDEVTLAQVLQKAGYRTAISGKWHLGHWAPEYLPTHRGFDRQYGHYNGMIDYEKHLRLGGFDWHRDDRACHDEGYSTDLIAEEAVRFIRQEVKDDPFFLYVPFNAIHTPLQAPQHWLMKVPQDVPKKDRVLQAMLYAVEDAVARVLEALEEKGVRENTLVLFLSDNGGEIYRSNDPYRDHKETVYEGGVRVVCAANWPGVIPAGTVVESAAHIVDLFPTILKLANVRADLPNPLDGRDIFEQMCGGPAPTDREILVNAEKRRGSIILGDMKLVVRGTPENCRMELAGTAGADFLYLYDLREDPYETVNLLDEMPQTAAQMLDRYEWYWKQAAPSVNEDTPVEGFAAPAVWGDFSEHTETDD